MDELERLQAENQELREQLAEFRRREVDALRANLAAAQADAVHYRAEAERNAATGRQIHAEAQAEINRLRDQVRRLQTIPNARPPAPGRPG